MRSVLLLAGLLVLTPAILRAEEPLSEADYRTTAEGWAESWTKGARRFTRSEEHCLAAYQSGEQLRDVIRATTPPPRFAEYHQLLLTYVESSLELQDECLLKPRGGPNWAAKATEAHAHRRAIARESRKGKLRLPLTW